MNIGLFIGASSSVYLLVLGLSTTQYELFSVISGIIGIVSLLIAGIMSGSNVNSTQHQVNDGITLNEKQKKRKNIMYFFFFIGAPNLIVGLILTSLYL